MGDFNLHTPLQRGMEWRPTQMRQFLLDANGKGLAQRIALSGVTVSHVDLFVQAISGTPGFGIEILTPYADSTLDANATPVQPFSGALYKPNTDTGKNTAGWENQAAGAATKTEISDGLVTTYHRNVSAVPAGMPIIEEFRLGSIVTTTDKRFPRLRVYADLACTAGTAYVRGVLNIGGARYYADPQLVQASNIQVNRFYWSWTFNPSTLLPWTAAEIEAFDSGTDEFGIEMQGVYSSTQPAQSFRTYELGVELIEAADNRDFYVYGTSLGGVGWLEKTVTQQAHAITPTWRWLHVFNWLNANAANWFQVPLLRDPNYPYVTVDPTTDDLRAIYETQMGDGGLIVAINRVVAGEMMPFLIESTAPAIRSVSNPYVLLDVFRPQPTAAATYAQEITTASGVQAYAGLAFPFGFENVSIPPDAPLVVEVRHGAGALSGGGTLDTTMTVRPADIAADPSFKDRIVAFTDPTTGVKTTFTPAVSTQYVIRFLTSATVGRGWVLSLLDTRSDIVGTGITAADVQGASIGGTTDSFAQAGVEDDRFDIAVAFIAPPTGPAGLTATLVPEVCEVTPNQVRLSWTATALTTAFGGYNLYRRARRAQAGVPELVGRIRVPPGRTPAAVEAQHTAFVDMTVPVSLAGGQYEYGFEYAVSVLNVASNLESALSWVGPIVPTAQPDTRWWVTSNDAPYAAQFVPSARAVQGGDQQRARRYNPAGADLFRVRTPIDLPGREYKLALAFHDGRGEDGFRYLRQLAARGWEVALVGPLGERVIGAIDAPGSLDYGPDWVGADVPLIETRRDAPPADFNLPAGLILNGSSQYVRVPTNALLNPGSADFTVVVAAVFAGSAGSKYALSKGNVGTADGYGIRTTGVANQVQFAVDGASISVGGPTDTSAVWFDGKLHVAAGGYTSGAQDLYRDGVLAAQTSLVAGAITNAVDLLLGANNGGAAAGFMAAAPIVAAAVYPRKLTAAEHQAAARYLLGVAGSRMPAGAVLFIDMRDDRVWTGLETVVRDLSGNGLHGTVVAAPASRGIVWPLAELERY